MLKVMVFLSLLPLGFYLQEPFVIITNFILQQSILKD